jgi:hypothetical protein
MEKVAQWRASKFVLIARYNLTNRSIRVRWARHVALMGEGRKLYSILVGKPEGRRPVGRPRHR